MRTSVFLNFKIEKHARPAGLIIKLRFIISGDSHRLPHTVLRKKAITSRNKLMTLKEKIKSYSAIIMKWRNANGNVSL